MNRRHFLTASTLASVVPASAFAGSSEAKADNRQFIELRHYTQLQGPRRSILNDYLRDVAIPAYNRMGIGPVGVFSVRYGPNAPSLYLLLPHPSIESVATANDRLMTDADYRKAAAAYLDVPLAEPAFARVETSLMRAFAGMPKVEAPADLENKKNRVLELRIYESHGEKAARKKIEMFDQGGEIQIFRDTGLTPVFFGETIIGPRMPNLTYMLVFDDMAARDKNWDAFGASPAWKELSAKEEYKDTVTTISDYILRPTGFSQI